MIKIVKGDLLQATENIIGHQVNCQNKMNSGVAKSIREKYPLAFEKFSKSSEIFIRTGRQEELFGKTQIIKVEKEKFVANLFGQFEYGYDGKKYTDESKLYEALKKLREVAQQENLSVALPYGIGCVRGGGDWDIVEEYISKAFEGYEVTLYKLDMG